MCELPDSAGVGLKHEHAARILASAPPLGWVEVHAENYMVAGGPRHAVLEAMRQRYPLSLHAVATSLGGAEPPDPDHLRALRGLVDRYQPVLVSEHVAWSVHDGIYFGDLLPVPLSRASLDRLCGHIDAVQTALGRQILIENPANYLIAPGAEMPEVAYLVEAARRTGCGLLVDVNNIYVSACNVGYDAPAYLDALPAELIREIHLAGHAVDCAGDEPLLIDDHGSAVAAAVWALHARLIRRVGRRPTLVEWDNNLPDWPVLLAEADAAQRQLERAAAVPDAAD
jgi:uncharacterized protein (UPF0276 family)